MAVKTIEHPGAGERRALGKEAGVRTPPSSHSGWRPAADRPDPVALLEAQNLTREPDLVPVRHGRMMVSPFTFYRGAAKIMAADLKETPVAGLDVQLCGDAHLSNFGVFASPERTLLFDLNDFDETLPGPFEYDVKRMAASFTIAARNNGFSEADTRAATLASVTAYREAMAGFADMPTMDIWYAHMNEDELMAAVRGVVAGAAKEAKGKKAKGRKAKEQAKAAEKAGRTAAKSAGKAHTRDSLQALSKLGEQVDGTYRIISDPPVVVPARDLAVTYGLSADEAGHAIREQFRAYRATLQDDRRRLLERFEIVDMARKVVGVGSVGTRAFIVLLQGRDARDPLFLQIKEATASVLEEHLPQEHLQAARGAGGAGAADDAGRQRHLPGLDQGAGRESPLLLAPAPGHEGLGAGRVDETAGADVLRAYLRVDAGAGACPVRRPGRHHRIPRRRRRVRRVDHRLLPALRRPEREGLPGIRDRRPVRAAGSPRRRLTTDAQASGPGMNAEFFALAFTAALNPKLLALDLLLIENRRPRAMFLCVLLGGMTVALTIGLLDVLTVHGDVITSQGKASAGVDLALGLLLLAAGALLATGRLHGRQRARSRPGPGRRTSRRSRRRRTAGRSGHWPSRGSGWPCWSAR